MAKYRIVGRSFRLGRGWRAKEFYGPVIASPEAFFLVIDRTEAQAVGGSLAGSLGGLIGGAVGGAIMAAAGGTGKQHDVTQHDYSELPEGITRHPDWPLKRKKGPVLVVPREAVAGICYSFWGTYDLETKEQVYCIGLKFFGRSGAISFLREAGWDEKSLRRGSPSAARQFAPLVGLFAGCAAGLVGGLVLKAPTVGVYSTPMLIGAGAVVGLIAGFVVAYAGSGSRPGR